MKVSELADTFKMSHTRLKRHTREILGPDQNPDVGMRLGKSRELGEQDSYKVYLGYHLISDLGFTMHEAKEILEDLEPWLREQGLFPGSKKKSSKIKIKRWIVNIMRFRQGENRGFSYGFTGIVSHKRDFCNGVKIEKIKQITDSWTPRAKKGSGPDLQQEEAFSPESYSPKILKASVLYTYFQLGISGELKNVL